MRTFFGEVTVVVVLLLLVQTSDENKLEDLPANFLPFHFATFPQVGQECRDDPECPYKAHLDKNVCWGYEDECVGTPAAGEKKPASYSKPICDGDHKGWVKSKKEQVDTFFEQADFGYVRKFRSGMRAICEPDTVDDSSLVCAESLTFCRARNIVIDFRRLADRKTPVMYDTDVLSEGEIGGHCKLDKGLLKSQLDQMGALQSWGPELQHFKQLSSKPFNKSAKLCDRVIKTPTFIMKIDATVNMYHHFCDFFNLYASLYVNQTSNNPGMFTKNVKILIWRTMKYSSSFEPAFRAFTSYPLLDLNDFKGKRVCFRNAVFPLLPRMIFGLFYNTPLIWGCQNSGLFHSFSKFMLTRLQIPLKVEPDTKKIKVTFISRLTKFRRVLNEDELLEELEKNKNLEVQKVVFTWKTDFVQQLRIIQDTDILIGMHGAGLTHALFLPDWAVVFELYNCGDEHCYKDLARLRGLKYLTWQDRGLMSEEAQVDSEYGPGHEKHQNYYFVKDEFVRLVEDGVSHVKDYKSRNPNQDDEAPNNNRGGHDDDAAPATNNREEL